MEITIRGNVKKGKLPPSPEGFEDDEWDLVERMCAMDPQRACQWNKSLRNLRSLRIEKETETSSGSTLFALR